MKNNLSEAMPMNTAPYEHQVRAFEFACKQFGAFDGRLNSRGAALLMEMGTGKTIASIAIAGYLYQKRLIKKLLIMVPLSILGVWEEEFSKFADFPYTITVLKGTSMQKKAALSSIAERRVLKKFVFKKI